MSPIDLSTLRGLLRTDAGIHLEEGKEYLVEGRLAPVARAAGLPDVASLVRQAAVAPGPLRRSVIEAMTTNETSFFRDRTPFDVMRTNVLPELVAARGASRRLRLWSAACSTGQEAVSLAIVLLDHFAQLANWDVAIHGTDINDRVVARARQARYGQVEVDRGLPPGALARHFRRAGADWEASQAVRSLCRYDVASLLDANLNGPFDVVFLRNVLIYFSPDTRSLVLRRVRAAMARDGWLLMGAAESSSRVPEGFRPHPVGGVTFFRPA